MKIPDWVAALSPEEREEAYEDACEMWGERYAEYGSSFVFGGGSVSDAGIVASMAAGRRPTREGYGLPPVPELPFIAGYVGGPPTTDAPAAVWSTDDDIPF